jgi:pilus assembly protein CpaB
MRTRILGIALAVVLALGGGVLLTGYVSNADARALAGARPVRVYVVVKEVPAKTPASRIAPYLSVKEIPAAAAVPGRVSTLTDLTGLSTAVALEPGEQLLRSRWVSPAAARAATAPTMRADMEAITVALPLEQAVGGDLHAGDLVGVAIASHDDSNQLDLAKVKLNRVPVLAVQQGTQLAQKGSAAGPVSTVMVTLAVEGDAATDIVWGQKWGTVWLLKQSRTTDAESGRTVKAGTCNSSCAAVHP